MTTKATNISKKSRTEDTNAQHKKPKITYNYEDTENKIPSMMKVVSKKASIKNNVLQAVTNIYLKK